MLHYRKTCHIFSSYFFKRYNMMVGRSITTCRRNFPTHSVGISTALATSLITNNSHGESVENPKVTLIDVSHKKMIQHACSSSVNSTSELLTQILIAVIDCAAKYKNCLNELILFLERNYEFAHHPSLRPTSDDEIIAARIQAKEYKDEFMELITMTEHIEKLATASAEVSFLIGAETLAMLISERLYSVQQKIQTEIEEVKQVENSYLEVQQTLIRNSGSDESDE